MKHLLLALLTLLPVGAMASETYEQAFVACSNAATDADDHSAAVKACMEGKGFKADADAPKQ